MANIKIFTDNIEQQALEQIKTLSANVAFRDAIIRIMPDVHAGIGSVIGFTSRHHSYIIPNVIGVDIGCGVTACQLAETAVDLQELDRVIHTYIPSGFKVHRDPQHYPLTEFYMHKKFRNIGRLQRSLGTLGGGNHFIELGQAEEGALYLIVHSGSRNLGHQVATYYQSISIKGEVKALQYLAAEDEVKYIHDMNLAQEFATANRRKILETLIEIMGLTPRKLIESVHNFYGEDGIIRKGAISAYENEAVIIPLNMRDGCILGVGKGNEDWNYSAPHGAGRIMSRKQARRILDLTEFRNEMQDIYTTSVSRDTIDEAPFAYKPSAEIIEAIQDTVEVQTVLRPIYNFKAKGD